ncbi:MAG TPA: transporter [Terriglobales bacterium]|nr:transporter [Terriglobales bacterium]
MRIESRTTVLICLYFLGAVAAYAQQRGQYVPGQQGLNSGLLPNPGITYANMTINYAADALITSSGGRVSLTGSYDLWAVANIFFYVPNFKIVGARPSFMAAPTFANGSVTLGSLNFPNVALEAGGVGLADTWVQPLTLGWSLKRADVLVGYAFNAPTGRYTSGASDNIGSGYWGHNLVTGSTLYLTKDKGTSAHLFTDWEFNHSGRATGQGTNLTPGKTFTMEWGLGQVLPLKKDLSRLLQLGLIGYDQWQVSENGGLLTARIPANVLPYYSVHAIGFQTNFILPVKALNFFFKFEDEYKALARPQGRTIVFGGSYTFHIPKHTAQPTHGAPATP